MQDTPKQEYVWEMGHICDSRSNTWYLDKVEPDGRYTVRGAANSIGSPNLPYFECMKEQFRAHPFSDWVKAQKREVPKPPIAAGSMAAVGSSTMSVEEAKKVSASFAGTSFVPPPRTIHDITAILDHPMREDLEAVSRGRALADQSPPAATDKVALSDFYFRRGWAAFEVGRPRQFLDDLTLALQYTPEISGTHRAQLLKDRALAESHSGDLTRAIAYLKEAVANVTPNQRARRIVLNCLLARDYSWAGNLEAAEAALGEAEKVRFEGRGRKGVRPTVGAESDAEIAIGRSYVLELKGRFTEQEQSLREAVQIFAAEASLAETRPAIAATFELARTLAWRGRLLEAEVEARRALLMALRKFGKTNYYSLSAASVLAGIIYKQGRYMDAEALARAILAIWGSSGEDGDTRSGVNPRHVLASALVSQELWKDAVAELDREDENRHKNQLSPAPIDPGFALAFIKVGRDSELAPRLEEAIVETTSRYGTGHPCVAELRAVLALAKAAQGDRTGGMADFVAALPVLLEPSRAIEEKGSAAGASARRREILLTAYVGLLTGPPGVPASSAATDQIAEAFRVAEAARGQVVGQALGASAARSTARTPELTGLIRQEQDAAKVIATLTGHLTNQLSLPTNEQDASVVRTLRTQIATLIEARQTLNERIRRDFPAYTQLVQPKPPTVQEVRAALRPGEALLSTYVAEDQTFVWAIPHTGPVAFASVAIGRGALATAVSELRQALDPGAKTLDKIPPFDVAKAHTLYRQLLEPVRSGWQSARSLLIVAHGPLGELPFGLLPTAPASLSLETAPLFVNYRAVPWLIRTHAVTVLPSVTSLVTLRALSAGDPTRRAFAGFGDPYFSLEQARQAGAEERAPTIPATAAEFDSTSSPGSPALVALGARGRPISLRDLKISKADSVSLALLPRLPDTAEEIRGIAIALNADLTRDVFLGARATEKAVKTMDLTRYRVIAFATHGLMPGDLDGLTQPALALTAPEVGDTDGDGLLTMEEILALRLNADWVVLSACNTASGQGAGAEAISGLGRAFFYAGARALLVSNWPVETTSARALTTDLFRRQAADPRLTRAQALQQTLNALIDGGGYVDPQSKQIVFSYAHPIFWAPFTLVGDGGGAQP
jgi:CHAT domain-containing protein/tetratricopeptide (TPR) repeat protein